MIGKNLGKVRSPLVKHFTFHSHQNGDRAMARRQEVEAGRRFFRVVEYDSPRTTRFVAGRQVANGAQLFNELSFNLKISAGIEGKSLGRVFFGVCSNFQIPGKERNKKPQEGQYARSKRPHILQFANCLRRALMASKPRIPPASPASEDGSGTEISSG